MKPAGIVRRVDQLGRIVIPKDLRNRYGWEEGQPLEMFMGSEGIFLRAYPLDGSTTPPSTEIERMDMR